MKHEKGEPFSHYVYFIKVKQYGVYNTINAIKSYLNYDQCQSTASVISVPEQKVCAVNKDTVNCNVLPVQRACRGGRATGSTTGG